MKGRWWTDADHVDAAREYVRRVSAEEGWRVEMREIGAPTYQLAIVSGEGFSLCVYPHTTSAHNVHMRVRDSGSRDKEAYKRAAGELYARSGNNCSFQTKHMSGNYFNSAVIRRAVTGPDLLQEIEREMGRPFIRVPSPPEASK